MAACDGQHIGLIPVNNDQASTSSGTHVGNDPAKTNVSAHMGLERTATSTSAHMGRDEATTSMNAHVGSNQPVPRAMQDIPPAVRRQVLRRDGGRCVFPGCRHATFVDVHHLKLRAEGGDHDPNNLATLCSAHHRAIHRGRVYIEGSIATGLQFRHADGTPYGASVATVASSVVDALALAFRALRGLGFGEAEVRRALQQAAPHMGPDANVELVVRRCLLTLTRRSAAPATRKSLPAPDASPSDRRRRRSRA